MRRARLTIALLVFTIFLLATAPAAFATATGGQGWYGETSDKTITQAMFIVIAFFPAVIIVFSVIQWATGQAQAREDGRAKRRAANADWRGGW